MENTGKNALYVQQVPLGLKRCQITKKNQACNLNYFELHLSEDISQLVSHLVENSVFKNP